MTERTRLLEYFDTAVTDGASRKRAAELIGISPRTLKRWRTVTGAVAEDKRPHAPRAQQPHQLTAAEEAVIVDTCNQREYQSLPPSQIVPRLADKGIYLASESTFYRVLKKHQQLNHRGRAQPAKTVLQPTSPDFS
jgi:putative transposase